VVVLAPVERFLGDESAHGAIKLAWKVLRVGSDALDEEALADWEE
jgi:hypothetical protein